MSMRARVMLVAAVLTGLSGCACSGSGRHGDAGTDPEQPDKTVQTQDARTLTCEGIELRIPALDESMTLAWATFQVAQENQQAFKELGAEARRSLFDTCVLPAIVGTK